MLVGAEQVASAFLIDCPSLVQYTKRGIMEVMGMLSLPVLLISMLLFLVLFFGIGFLLNMLLRMSWIMAIVYPIVCIFIIDEVRFIEYFQKPGDSFSSLGHKITSLALADILILLSGLIGAILSGVVIKMLRKRGYQMF